MMDIVVMWESGKRLLFFHFPTPDPWFVTRRIAASMFPRLNIASIICFVSGQGRALIAMEFDAPSPDPL